MPQSRPSRWKYPGQARLCPNARRRRAHLPTTNDRGSDWREDFLAARSCGSLLARFSNQPVDGAEHAYMCSTPAEVGMVELLYDLVTVWRIRPIQAACNSRHDAVDTVTALCGLLFQKDLAHSLHPAAGRCPLDRRDMAPFDGPG